MPAINEEDTNINVDQENVDEDGEETGDNDEAQPDDCDLQLTAPPVIGVAPRCRSQRSVSKRQ